jgi:hypothetical protein
MDIFIASSLLKSLGTLSLVPFKNVAEKLPVGCAERVVTSE